MPDAKDSAPQQTAMERSSRADNERELENAPFIPEGAHEMGASGVTEVLTPKQSERADEPDVVERYLDSKVYKEHGAAFGRGPPDLGLVGKGHVVAGHMILMDVDSGDFVRVMPGTKLEDDRVFLNTRNRPPWMIEKPEVGQGKRRR